MQTALRKPTDLQRWSGFWRGSVAFAATILIAGSAAGQSSPHLLPLPLPQSLAVLEFKVDDTPPFAVLASGILVLFDVDDNQIVFINAATGSASRFGRTGEGPGEFRGITDFAAASDGRLLALSASRITILGPDQKLVTTVRLPIPFAGLGGRVAKDSAFVLDTKYDTVYSISLRTGGIHARFGQRADDSLHFRGPEPYERGFWIVPRGENDWFVASGYKYYIIAEDGNGAHLGTIERSPEPEMPTKGELDDARRQMRRGNPNANLDKFMQRMASTPKPYIIVSPVQDAKGRLWVPTGRMRSDSSEVDVFSSAGTQLGSVRVPGIIRKMATDQDRLYVITKQIVGKMAGDCGVLGYRVK